MNNIIIALCIGIVAGIIDVVPMIVQKLEKRANISAFIHYTILGVVIPFVCWEIQPWLKGLIIAELAAIPVMVIVTAKDKKAIVPMVIFAALLGSGIGWAGDFFIGLP